MGFFDFLRAPDISRGLTEFAETPGAVLLDVRTPEEYAQGRLPGSRNIPLDEIGRTAELIADRNTPLFVYCHSGARSSRAVAALRRMGCQNVVNIGGIAGYHGKVER